MKSADFLIIVIILNKYYLFHKVEEIHKNLVVTEALMMMVKRVHTLLVELGFEVP